MNTRTWKRHTLLAASLAIVLVAIGCGRQGTQASNAEAGGKGGSMKLATSQTGGPRDEGGLSLATRTPEAEPEGGVGAPGAGTPAGDTSGVSEPPDVEASIADSVMVPGGVVQITAHASSDAVEVVLMDGNGNPKQLVYDAVSGLWTTTYRVPLRAATERIGLSITAKNAHQQWRRVWLFTRTSATEVASEPKVEDGSSGQ